MAWLGPRSNYPHVDPHTVGELYLNSYMAAADAGKAPIAPSRFQIMRREKELYEQCQEYVASMHGVEMLPSLFQIIAVNGQNNKAETIGFVNGL
jgi:hypothetical protein